MPLLETNSPRRDQPYMTRSALAAAARIFALVDDYSVPAPLSPPPTLPSREQAVFDRITAACRPGAVPAEVMDVRSTGAQPPPPRQRRRR